MRKIILSCAAATLLFSACKKSDSGNSSKAGILSSGKWQLTARTSQTTTNGVAGTLHDEYISLPACEKDNYVLFSSNTYIITDEGATKCNASDPQQTTQGTWTLMNNDALLRQSNPIVTVDWNINQLDDNTLKMTWTEVNNNGSTTVVYNSSETYKHIN